MARPLTLSTVIFVPMNILASIMEKTGVVEVSTVNRVSGMSVTAPK